MKPQPITNHNERDREDLNRSLRDAMSPKWACESWNNGKSGARLDLTSSTTTGLQILSLLIFCISATPYLGTSFPLFHDAVVVVCSILSAVAPHNRWKDNSHFRPRVSLFIYLLIGRCCCCWWPTGRCHSIYWAIQLFMHCQRTPPPAPGLLVLTQFCPDFAILTVFVSCF